MVVHNQSLKESLELLMRRTLPLYNEVVGLDIADPNTNSSKVFHLQETIEEFEEYKSCLQIISKDQRLSGFSIPVVISSELVSGTQGLDVNINDLVFGFLKVCYLQNRSFNSAVFDNYYEKFANFCYSDRPEFTDVVKLYAFESDIDEIDLGEGIFIRRVSQNKASGFMAMRSANFELQRIYRQDYLLLAESKDWFDTVIKTLRVLKPSAVYIDAEIVARAMTSYPITNQRFGMFEVRFRPLCMLSSQEADELKRLFKRVRTVKNETFQIALDRLSFGMERRLDEDQFLDYMIALEALYLPDGNDELSFRLALRVAFTVAQGIKERKDTFRFMRRMYTQRSNIAHGNKKKNLTREDVLQTENILRTSLKKYLEDENLFTVDKRNNNGKLVKEGILDTIYFEQQGLLHFPLFLNILEAGLVGDREQVRTYGEKLLQQLESDEGLAGEDRMRVISDLHRSLERNPPEAKDQIDHPVTRGEQDQGAGSL